MVAKLACWIRGYNSKSSNKTTFVKEFTRIWSYCLLLHKTSSSTTEQDIKIGKIQWREKNPQFFSTLLVAFLQLIEKIINPMQEINIHRFRCEINYQNVMLTFSCKTLLPMRPDLQLLPAPTLKSPAEILIFKVPLTL